MKLLFFLGLYARSSHPAPRFLLLVQQTAQGQAQGSAALTDARSQVCSLMLFGFPSCNLDTDGTPLESAVKIKAHFIYLKNYLSDISFFPL